MARILAIDYGSKRVGLAVTDPLQIIATALTTVPSHEVMAFLKKYVEKEPVECFVVGEASDLNDEPTHSSRLIADFVKGLKKNFPGMAVVMEDERFTSKMAFQTMIESGIGKAKRRDKATIDKISATLILQSYLERKKNTL